MAIDPVCGMKVDENTSELQTQFAGKKYFSVRKTANRNSRIGPMNLQRRRQL